MTPAASAPPLSPQPPVISHFQVGAWLRAHAAERTSLRSTLDLGLTEVVVTLDAHGATLPGGVTLTYEALAPVMDHENLCYEVVDGALQPIRSYSEALSRTYQLMPTPGAPAMLISGFVMHRFRDVSPDAGARAMVKAVMPTRGRVLDTATGLGYAAIAAAQKASEVVTIELDPHAQGMARRNPWSRGLFDNPKVTQLIGNSADVITTFEAEAFAAIVHDPPAINLAGELYAQSFYAEAFRVLGRGGKFFHYIGDPKSASGGRTTQGVVKRLHAVGFKKVVPRPEAFGVLASR